MSKQQKKMALFTGEDIFKECLASPKLRKALERSVGEGNVESFLNDLSTNQIILTPEEQQEFWAMFKATRLWRSDLVDGEGTPIISPPFFDEFVNSPAYMGLSKEGMKFTDRQDSFFRRGLNFDPAFVFDHAKEVTTLVALWGKGCLASDQKLKDYRTGEIKTVEEWEKDGSRLTLPVWNEVTECVVMARTLPVFLKGEESIYKITLIDGREFRATLEHKNLTPNGWRMVGELNEGELLLSKSGDTSEWVEIKSISEDGYGKFYDLTVPDYHNYFDAQNINHSNSGKDMVTSFLLAWIAFVINSMRDPWEYLGSVGGEAIDVLNIATTSDQANSVFFNKLKSRLKKPCFSQFKPTINKQIIQFMRLIPGDREPTILLQLHSLHAKAASWEGKNVIFWVMDEADAFEDDSGQSNADKCYNTMVSSARTRFENRWLGVVISFKRQQDGFMDRKVAESKKSSSVVVDEATTFQVRPNLSRDSFADDYERDYDQARMHYENIAPPVVGAFFTHFNKIDEGLDHNRKAVIAWEEVITHRKVEGMDNEFVGLNITNIRGDMDRYYFMHGDPGLVDASFALGMCHIETGWAVARGHDNVIDDFYQGFVLTDQSNMPIPLAVVIYADKSGREVGRTQTDENGRHYLWLPPGVYDYVFIDRHGKIGNTKRDLTIKAGLEISVATDRVDSGGETIYERQTVYPIVEDFIVEWKPQPGRPVDYDNVEKFIKKVKQHFNLYIVTFDSFDSPQMIQNLQASGINAQSMAFGKQEQLRVFKNFRSLLYNGLWRGLGNGIGKWGEKRRHQLRGIRLKGETILSREGETKDLADATVVPPFHAIKIMGAMLASEKALSESDDASFISRVPFLGQGRVVTSLDPLGRPQSPFTSNQLPSHLFNPSSVPAARGAAPILPNKIAGVDDVGQSPIDPNTPYY